MSNQVGVVEVISPRGKAFNAKIDGKWYGLGFSKPEIVVGNKVEFEIEMNGAFANAKNFKVLKSEVARAPSVASTGATYIRNDSTQKAIQYQAARNAAIEVTKLAVDKGLIKLPAKQADQLDVALALIDEITERYDVAVTAHVTGNDKPAKAAKPAEEDEVE
jgi:hypothetical protein